MALILIISIVSLVSCTKIGVGEHSTPDSPDNTPKVSDTEWVPVDDDTPNDSESTPAASESTPVEPESTPAASESTPVEPESTPAASETENNPVEPDAPDTTSPTPETDAPKPEETKPAEPETTKNQGGYITLPRDEF